MRPLLTVPAKLATACDGPSGGTRVVSGMLGAVCTAVL